MKAKFTNRGPLKIAVYTIALNEEKNVDQWFASCMSADYVTFCDTGSKDQTRTKLLNHNFQMGYGYRDTVHKIHISPWRFDDAHNAALALVPADADICIPLHLDERLTLGWRERIEEACRGYPKGEPTKLFYQYKFSDELTFVQNRIHARNGYRWRYPCHEGIYTYFDTKEWTKTIKGDEPLIVQHQDPRQRDRLNSNLYLLKHAYAEDPNDTRMLYYLGREYMYAGEYKAAITLLCQYFSVDANHPLEQREAAKALAYCYQEIGGK